MSSSLIIATLAAGLAGFAPPAIGVSSMTVAVAGDCGQAAAQVVAETGGDLLSAEPTGDGKCRIIVLVPGNSDNGGRPTKEIRYVAM